MREGLGWRGSIYFIVGGRDALQAKAGVRLEIDWTRRDGCCAAAHPLLALAADMDRVIIYTEPLRLGWLAAKQTASRRSASSYMH